MARRFISVAGLKSFDLDLDFGQARADLRPLLWSATVCREERLLSVDFESDSDSRDG